MEISQEIIDVIKKAADDYSQGVLAHKAGVTPRTIHSIIKGKGCKQVTLDLILTAIDRLNKKRQETLNSVLSKL